GRQDFTLGHSSGTSIAHSRTVSHASWLLFRSWGTSYVSLPRVRLHSNRAAHRGRDHWHPCLDRDSEVLVDEGQGVYGNDEVRPPQSRDGGRVVLLHKRRLLDQPYRNQFSTVPRHDGHDWRSFAVRVVGHCKSPGRVVVVLRHLHRHCDTAFASHR